MSGFLLFQAPAAPLLYPTEPSEPKPPDSSLKPQTREDHFKPQAVSLRALCGVVSTPKVFIQDPAFVVVYLRNPCSLELAFSFESA